MNRLFLELAMLPAGFYRSSGADTDQLRAILSVKLKMDDRRPITFGRQQQKRNTRYSTVKSMIFSALFGFVYLFVLFAVKEPVIAIAAFFGFFLFMLCYTLLTDFSNVLFDTKDKFILLPRPVSDRTIFLSRTLHVFLYLMRIVLPMSLPGWVMVGIEFGWKYSLWFPVPLLCMVFFALFFMNACYLLIMKLSKPEKFKDALNYLQVGVSIVFFAAYAILPRMIDGAALGDVNWQEMGWMRYAPSYWLAATFSWIGAPEAIGHTKYIGILALVVPFACVWVSTRFLAPKLAATLGALDMAEIKKPAKPGTHKKGGLYWRLADLFNRTDAAKAGFMITWLQTGRSRNFRMKVYPSFAFVPVYFVVMLMQSGKSVSEVWESLPSRPMHLIFLYLSFFVLLQVISYVSVSEQYRAAWVYYAAPVQTPGHVMAGSLKALWVKYFLPFFIVMNAIVLYVWGARAITDCLLALTNITLAALCILRINMRHLPFSQMEQMKNAAGRTTIRVLVTFLIMGVLGVGHGFVWMAGTKWGLWWLPLVFLVLSFVFLWLVWDSYRSTDWSSIRREEE